MSSFSYINNDSGIKMYDRIKIIILYNDYIIRTVGGVVVLKKGCQCGWLPESFPETGMRAVFVISQAPDSAYVRIE